MKMTYETQGYDTYLVCELDSVSVLDTASLGMLTNNLIPGIVPLTVSQIDNVCYLKYKITARVPATQIFSGAIKKKQLLTFLSTICTAIIEISDYMLNVTELLLDLNYIYVDVSSCSAELICLPVKNLANRSDMVTFFRNIVISAQYAPDENKDYVGELVSYLGTAGFVPDGFLRLLAKLSAETNRAASPLHNPVVQQPPRAPESIQVPSAPFTPSAPPAPSMPVNAPKPPAGVPSILRSVLPKPANSQPVPERPPAAQTAEAPAANAEKMSLFYLLQHYNKSNKAIYDAQQQQKKMMGNKKDAPRKADAKPVGYSIPGQVSAAPQPNSYTPAQPQPQQPAQQYAQPQVQQYAQPQAQQYAQPQAQPIPSEPMYQQAVLPDNPQQRANFGDTEYIDNDPESEGTMFLNGPQSQSPSVLTPILVRQNNKERIAINKPLFRLGRAEHYADYCISGNLHIGSAHCHILSRGGEYFIVDDNSKNHTYVNGAMIQGSVEVKITHGTSIRLADENFEFILN
jgi:pSer/pThr/pTyr-binding forkhead associated (FHA) protein